MRNSRTAFQLLCRCLSGVLGKGLASSDLPANESEWEKVLQLSSAHLATPQLRWALRQQGLVSGLPEGVSNYLEAVYTLNQEKNSRCEEQLAHLIELLNSIGVRPVLLKGAAAIVSELYPTCGERMITDLDILIPAADLPKILDKLAGAGYRRLDGESRMAVDDPDDLSHHHYPGIYSPDWPVSVELHLTPVFLRYVRLLSSEEVFRDATWTRWRGGECLLPSPTHFVMHNVIHSFLVDTRFKLRRVSLRQLFEFVLTSRTYAERVDWPSIIRRFTDHGHGKALRQYLALAKTCFGQPLPEGLPVDRWSRLRVRLHLFRHELNHGALEWVMNLLSQLKSRSFNLLSHPDRIRKLLTIRWYARFFAAIGVSSRGR